MRAPTPRPSFIPQRLQISRSGLRFFSKNPLEKNIHGIVKYIRFQSPHTSMTFRKRASMKQHFFLSVLCCISLAYAQQTSDNTKGTGSPKKLTVAVTDFDGKGLAEGEPKTLTDAFRSYLINTGGFRVMERGQMDAILKEQGFQSSGACTDQACMVEMGQLLGVDNIIAGSIGKVGVTFSINVRVVSVQTGEIIKSANRFHKGEIDGLLTEVLPAMANDLVDKEAAPHAAVQPAPQAAAVAQPESAPTPKKDAAPRVEKPKKRKTGLVVGLTVGVIAAGGGAAAFFLTKKKDDSFIPETPTQTGEISISWE
jgi:TolB-like protein